MIALRKNEMRRISNISQLPDTVKLIITYGIILSTKYNTMISIQELGKKTWLGSRKSQRMRRLTLMRS